MVTWNNARAVTTTERLTCIFAGEERRSISVSILEDKVEFRQTEPHQKGTIFDSIKKNLMKEGQCVPEIVVTVSHSWRDDLWSPSAENASQGAERNEQGHILIIIKPQISLPLIVRDDGPCHVQVSSHVEALHMKWSWLLQIFWFFFFFIASLSDRGSVWALIIPDKLSLRLLALIYVDKHECLNMSSGIPSLQLISSTMTTKDCAEMETFDHVTSPLSFSTFRCDSLPGHIVIVILFFRTIYVLYLHHDGKGKGMRCLSSVTHNIFIWLTISALAYSDPSKDSSYCFQSFSLK